MTQQQVHIPCAALAISEVDSGVNAAPSPAPRFCQSACCALFVVHSAELSFPQAAAACHSCLPVDASTGVNVDLQRDLRYRSAFGTYVLHPLHIKQHLHYSSIVPSAFL